MESALMEKAEWLHDLNKYSEKNNILFVGSSFIHQFPIHELEFNFHMADAVYNRGIEGIRISQLRELLDVCIFELAPAKIVFNIGDEDIKAQDFNLERFTKEYIEIIDCIQKRLPSVKIYVMAVLPVNQRYQMVNDKLSAVLKEKRIAFLDFNKKLLDETHQLHNEFTKNGHYFLPEVYVLILKELKHFLREKKMKFTDVWDMIDNWY